MEDKSFLIEGKNSVLEALKAGRPMNKIYVKKGDRAFIKRINELARQNNVPVVEVDENYLNRISETKKHQGVIAQASLKPYLDFEELLTKASSKTREPFIAVLNEIEDPVNLGSILRTCDCLGVNGVIIPKRRACGVTPTVMKVSEGAGEYVDIARVTNIASTLEKLKEKGIWVVGADMDGEVYYEKDLTGPLALVVGGEDKGLGKLVKERCDFLVKIPMMGHVTSMNAAVAFAVIGYEIIRQRALKDAGKA
ncbi:23S rRNA (guanosine(2251)-2'-O)-methyltransferase RlmB [Thermovenabulum gondwanense]|uniref:Putative TrmH family tRNA/rRNA methyltransferase n=1 Tax=Thermovenabulum gondwanense TaxID=520767 RepID=A0A162MUQ9_9FIRM|nr:23S rRNA (guanosine(2251)-2'-O)-methyltransferase RlmB [Thermovenabulum gondwanense]KYO67393.1 putative TrmH family tRNA/rRNA methyltransferase [Thermovenabulum gondwanense]